MKYIYYLSVILLFSFCSSQTKVDLLVFNAKIYTVSNDFSMAEAFVVKDGKFIEVGSSDDISKKYIAKKTIDAGGKPVYPGFYDAHCHFYSLGRALSHVDLVDTKSYEEVIQRVKEFAEKHPSHTWILGRGWDQNDWEVKNFPDKQPLDSLFPNRGVLLRRIDGHAALVNQKALDLAQIDKNYSVEGGSVVLKNNEITGVLIDNAIGVVEKIIPSPTDEEIKKQILEAQKVCFSYGLTTLSDAGSSKKIIETFEQMYQEGDLKIRLYVMAEPKDRDYIFERGKIKTDRLNIRSFKLYADGALGSRGACLLKPYQDRKEETGFLLNSKENLEELVKQIYNQGFQANTHCIGDSANRLMLDMYSQYLTKENDLRWRIEHAQIVDKADIDKFGEFHIIPSVQPTHATSDMYWAEDRLGKERLQNAYTFNDLLLQNGMLALGSDFPVEFSNPLLGFYAAISRKDIQGYPEEGFQIENKLQKKDALKGMTIWSAYANFEEKERGSIEKDKQADFVILSQDIMEIDEKNIVETQVINTYVAGEEVFSKK